ncbi:hypothetical protein Pst134EA_027750 [Puccinia striiformis f. sp. tritici]|uniref:hypothetical protein n=1 Tax=Puccinia striiformis f. sp. tritici TaxID=168172 RepID=UPI002007A588|nr:hypothetical protein Pst134EA_027750 [Puccinia striiformis f. sp. tritici]KAH9448440.1 hypothetical protein Pst134EA_027750 [Puccinia striiformis f. sp. tritici]
MVAQNSSFSASSLAGYDHPTLAVLLELINPLPDSTLIESSEFQTKLKSQFSIPQRIIRQSKPLHVYHQSVDKLSLTHDYNDGNNAAAASNAHQHPQSTIKLSAASDSQ